MEIEAGNENRSLGIKPKLLFRLAPRDGFEPPTKRLTISCSTAELPGIRCDIHSLNVGRI